MKKRAVFADGYVSHTYSGETEEEIRRKVELENGRAPGMKYVLVEENVPNFHEAVRAAKNL